MSAPQRFSCGVWPAINMGHAYSDKISRRDAGSTVQQFYQEHYTSSGSAVEWLQRINNNQVTYTASGKPLALDTVLKAGDQVTYFRLPWAEPDAPNYFVVLHEDEHVLVLAKPAGLQVLPKAAFCQRTVLGLLQSYHEQHRRLQYPDSLVPVPVHRLGRGTSGVLLCAATPAARQKLAKDFSTSTKLGVALTTAGSSSSSSSTGVPDAGSSAAEQRPLGKKYRALVSGVFLQDEGEVDVPIGPVAYPGLSTGLFAASSSGKPARSLYRVLHRHAGSTLVEVTILTGRPHQIRIHMAALGHPLVGDPLYGVGGVPLDVVLSGSKQGAYGDAQSVMPGDCGYHLHSMDLRFTHPATGAQLRVTAPIPDVLLVPGESQLAGDDTAAATLA